jgi:hypothetical protein
MKSMKKMFALFAVFSMMVTCLSLSSFALEPDTVPSDTTPDADAAMSETDIAADAIEEDTLVMPEYDAVLDDVISEIAPEAEIVESDNIYPACKHDYIRSPVGSRYQVYDSEKNQYGYAQDYIYRCSKCGEYYYHTEYSEWHY